MIIRSWRIDDDVEALTHMLHRAYAPLAARGLRYGATHQAPEATRRRLIGGHAFVAQSGIRLVGTITSYAPDPAATVQAYRESTTYHFGQFGVDPEFKGRGVGRALYAAMVDDAIRRGAKFMALDTAAPATDLIALYERWGYSVVERTRWDSTNYESVIMQRRIAP